MNTHNEEARRHWEKIENEIKVQNNGRGMDKTCDIESSREREYEWKRKKRNENKHV